MKGFIDLFVVVPDGCRCDTAPVVYSRSWSFDSGLGTVACALILVWLSMAAIAKSESCTVSVAAGREEMEPKAIRFRHADRSTIQTLKALLSSEDERQVLYALDLLSNTDPDR